MNPVQKHAMLPHADPKQHRQKHNPKYLCVYLAGHPFPPCWRLLRFCAGGPAECKEDATSIGYAARETRYSDLANLRGLLRPIRAARTIRQNGDAPGPCELVGRGFPSQVPGSPGCIAESSSDAYTLGVIRYELLTDAKPYGPLNWTDLQRFVKWIHRRPASL